jgi:CheY-like chemotaxis protein
LGHCHFVATACRMVQMAKKRIILVEDELDMAELVAMRLKREFYEVEAVHDGRDALDRIRCNPPDLVLLDIMLPGLSGPHSHVVQTKRQTLKTIGKFGHIFLPAGQGQP